jgi:hypothetical protein
VRGGVNSAIQGLICGFLESADDFGIVGGVFEA